MGNRMFEQKEVPIKWVLQDFEHADSTPLKFKKFLEQSRAAAFWYSRAFIFRHVKGPPVELLRVKLSVQPQKDGLVEDTLRGGRYQHTLGFARPIEPENYPDIQDYVVHYLSKEFGDRILQMGKDLVDKTIIIPGINDSNKRRKSGGLSEEPENYNHQHLHHPHRPVAPLMKCTFD